MTIVPRGGPARTCVASGGPLVAEDGRKSGAVVAMHDITGRRRAEEALRRNRDQLTQLADNLPHSIVYQFIPGANGNRRFTYVSGAAQRILGVTPEEVVADAGVLDRQVLEPFRPVMEQAEAAAAENQRVFDVEVPVRVTDGSVKWLHICSMPYRGEDGQTVWNGIATDVTDRKRMEEALRASEESHRLFIETIPQLAWRTSHGGLDVECNRRWYEYTGQTPAQVGGWGWLAVVHPDDLARIAEKILHATNSGEPYELEYRLRRASDNSYRWHLSRALPLREQDGQITSWFGCATDIEELKQAQEILKEAHDEQLQRHREELAHVARIATMGEMAASLAHELNQPLQAVITYADGSIMRLAKQPDKDEQLVSTLEQISQEAKRAGQIIRRIRGFVEKRQPQVSAVLVNELVDDCIRLNHAELERRRIHVVMELGQDLPPLRGDPVQIEQVILNLVRNAMESMDETPDDSRRLSVRTSPDGAFAVQVDVCDHGKGIGNEPLEKLFEPFFTTKPEGMGMGLAISRSIVQAHEGRLWASVNEEGGCTFHFTLPAARKD